jgi:hypothetical protein
MSREPSRLSSFLVLRYAIPIDFVHSRTRLSEIEHSMVPDETQGRRQPNRRSKILQRLVAKPKSLWEFLLIVIKVNQVGIVFGILFVSPAHHHVRCNDAANRGCHMPETGF